MDSEVNDLGTTSAASVVSNGQNLNGQNLNGQNLNGQNLNGQNLNGQNLNTSALGYAIKFVSKSGAQLNGASLQGIALVGSELRGTIGGSARAGLAVEGAEFVAQSDSGQALALRIDVVEPPAAGSDVWRYQVEYQETDASWQPICIDADGVPLSAIALGGYWDRRSGVSGGGAKIADPNAFTFACPKVGAVGKCVDIGYRPWASVNGVSLDSRHQACVRLIRNDYCGDGTAHTVDGNLINIHDSMSIQTDTENWLTEAEWDKNGARCLTLNNRAPLALPCRGLLTGVLQMLSCGAQSHFATGTLLMTERPLLDGL